MQRQPLIHGELDPPALLPELSPQAMSIAGLEHLDVRLDPCFMIVEIALQSGPLFLPRHHAEGMRPAQDKPFAEPKKGVAPSARAPQTIRTVSHKTTEDGDIYECV